MFPWNLVMLAKAQLESWLCLGIKHMNASSFMVVAKMEFQRSILSLPPSCL
jgi:hypothetical protein